MSLRELLVLGSSSQVPTRERAHHASFLAWDDFGILFDPGEGTQRQMIFAGLAPPRITAICITHFHGDHSLGLAGVAQRLSLDGVDRPVPVLFPASGLPYFERLVRATIYRQVTELVPIPVSSEGEVLRLDGARLFAAPLDHDVDVFGYRLVEDDGRTMDPERLRGAGIEGADVGELKRSGEIERNGRRTGIEEVSSPRPGQVFSFVMDTRPCGGASRLLEKADLALCESTYLEEEAPLAAAHGHLTALQAARLAREAGVRRLALTHFSQRYRELDRFREEAAAEHPDVRICDDLSRVPVPARRSAEE
jgi:ribonuclease Z